MNRTWTFWLLPVGVGLLTIITTIFLVVVHERGRDAFVRTWSHGPYAATSCPPFGVYPIPLVNCLGSSAGEACVPARAEDLQRAMMLWNQVGAEEKFGAFFRLGTITDRQAVPLYAADKAHYRMGGRCEYFTAQDEGLQSDTIGWTTFPYNAHYSGTTVHLCVDRYDRGVGMWKTKTRRALRRIELWGFIAHELGHLILGPKGELDPYGELMASSPSSRTISVMARRIVREKVIARCGR